MHAGKYSLQLFIAAASLVLLEFLMCTLHVLLSASTD